MSNELMPRMQMVPALTTRKIVLRLLHLVEAESSTKRQKRSLDTEYSSGVVSTESISLGTESSHSTLSIVS
ncbi:unnamed protein product [Caretta caretta]